MDALAIINKYYPEDNELKHILLTHRRSVADKALWIADRHPELELDRSFLEEAALLHDIGVFLTDAPGIHCYGTNPYICHGYLGSQLMQQEGYPRHALVCERHTGAGMSLQSILAQLASAYRRLCLIQRRKSANWQRMCDWLSPLRTQQKPVESAL